VEQVRSWDLWKVGFDPAKGTVRGEPIRVTKGSRQEGWPNVSPDGEWLAYMSVGAQEDVFIMRTDGTSRRQLTDDIYKDRNPRWSPDGKKLGFMSNRSGTYQIWIINTDGSGLQQFSQAPDRDIAGPIWSPDGSRIGYWDYQEGTFYICDGRKPWKEQNPLALPLLSPAESLDVFSWSPDGRLLAAGVNSDDGSAVGIAAYSLESQQYRRLTDFGRRPVFLSDSRRILFRDSGELYLLDSESGKVDEVLSVSPDHFNLFSVSPDNRSIYFTRNSSEADIWMLSLNEEKK
jgi:Tol biopolymer transport system component